MPFAVPGSRSAEVPSAKGQGPSSKEQPAPLRRRSTIHHPSSSIRRRRSVSGTLDETRFVLRDYLDPVAIITAAGVVDERYSYDAFGPVRVMDANFATRSNSTWAWNWLHHGEFLDTESGMYDYGYRFYHPALGRWASRDPIGERGGLNLYGFVGNLPTAKIDYIGLATVIVEIIEDVGKGVVDINPFRDKPITENDVSDRIYPQIRRQVTKRIEKEIIEIACCSLPPEIREFARMLGLCKDSTESDSNIEITTVLQIIEDQRISTKIEIWPWGRDGTGPSVVANIGVNQDGHVSIKGEIPIDVRLPDGNILEIVPFVNINNINNNRKEVEILPGLGLKIEF